MTKSDLPVDENMRLVLANHERNFIQEQCDFYKRCIDYCIYAIFGFIASMIILPVMFEILAGWQLFLIPILFSSFVAGVSGLIGIIPVWIKFRFWKKAQKEHAEFLQKYNRN